MAEALANYNAGKPKKIPAGAAAQMNQRTSARAAARLTEERRQEWLDSLEFRRIVEPGAASLAAKADLEGEKRHMEAAKARILELEKSKKAKELDVAAIFERLKREVRGTAPPVSEDPARTHVRLGVRDPAEPLDGGGRLFELAPRPADQSHVRAAPGQGQRPGPAPAPAAGRGRFYTSGLRRRAGVDAGNHITDVYCLSLFDHDVEHAIGARGKFDRGFVGLELGDDIVGRHGVAVVSDPVGDGRLGH